MFITDSQNSPLKNISDISGNLAYRGQIISGVGGGSQGGGIIGNSSGCYLSLSGSGGQYLNSGTPNAIFWNGIIRNQNISWNNSEPSKIYINNASGYYNISADISLDSNSVFDTYFWIKNGNKSLSNNNSNISNVYLNSGDYIEYYINSYTGTNISGNISCDIVRIPEQPAISISTKLFSPLDIPGCVRWYSASSGVLNSGGNPCSQGEEVYILKNLAQNSYINGDISSHTYSRSIYLTGILNGSFPVLDFQSSGTYTGISNLRLEGLQNSFTIITKRNKKFTTGSANIFQIGNNSTTNRLTLHAPFSNGTTYCDAGNATSLRLNGECQINNSGEWDIIIAKRRQSSSEFIINNRQYLNINSSSWPNFNNETGLFCLGTSFPTPDHNADCNSYITDFLMYNRDLSAGELSLIDQYLGGYAPAGGGRN